MSLSSRILFLLALNVIAIVALLSPAQLGFSLEGIDKLAHLAAFFGLALLGAIGWPRHRALFLIGLPVLGIVIEAAQSMIPAREFDWADALVNGAGVGTGVALATLLVGRIVPTPRVDRESETGLPSGK